MPHFPQGDVLPPEGGDNREEPERPIDSEELAIRFEQLKGWYPEWFRYSDTLGERPIDGMIRELQTNYQLRRESKRQEDQGVINKLDQIEQNRAVAPGYTNELQMQAPPGEAMEMGPVL